jgi:hypothetical protein
VLIPFFEKNFGETVDDQQLPLPSLSENMNLMKENVFNLTVENIKRGNSNIRNPILASYTNTTSFWP